MLMAFTATLLFLLVVHDSVSLFKLFLGGRLAEVRYGDSKADVGEVETTGEKLRAAGRNGVGAGNFTTTVY